jgi:hypothetical protein
MARVPAQATAFAHRDRRIMANVAAFYERPQYQPVREAWVANFAATLRQGGEPGAYVGFLDDESRSQSAKPTRVDLGPPRSDQASLRPSQPPPAQPEHPASDRGHPRTVTDGAPRVRAHGRQPGFATVQWVVIMDHHRLAARASRDCRSAGPDEDRADRRATVGPADLAMLAGQADDRTADQGCRWQLGVRIVERWAHRPLQHPNLWLLIAGPTIRLGPRHAKVRRDGYRR